MVLGPSAIWFGLKERFRIPWKMAKTALWITLMLVYCHSTFSCAFRCQVSNCKDVRIELLCTQMNLQQPRTDENGHKTIRLPLFWVKKTLFLNNLWRMYARLRLAWALCDTTLLRTHTHLRPPMHVHTAVLSGVSSHEANVNWKACSLYLTFQIDIFKRLFLQNTKEMQHKAKSVWQKN